MDFIRDVFTQSPMTGRIHLKNYGKKTVLSQYPREMYKSWPQKNSDSVKGYLQKVWLSSSLLANL